MDRGLSTNLDNRSTLSIPNRLNLNTDDEQDEDEYLTKEHQSATLPNRLVQNFTRNNGQFNSPNIQLDASSGAFNNNNNSNQTTPMINMQNRKPSQTTLPPRKSFDDVEDEFYTVI